MIAKITIPEKVYKYENILNDPKYQRSGQFIENMVCDNHIVYCNRWFHLANFTEMLEDVREYFQIMIPNFTTDGQFSTYTKVGDRIIRAPLQYINEDGVSPIECGVRTRNPIVYYGKRPKVERV